MSAPREWVLSRYEDVLAAFKEPRLLPISSSGASDHNARNERGTLLARHEVADTLSGARLAEWERAMALTAGDMLGRLPSGRPVELLAEFAKLLRHPGDAIHQRTESGFSWPSSVYVQWRRSTQSMAVDAAPGSA